MLVRAVQVLCCSERTPAVVLATPAADVPQLAHSLASSLSCSVHIQLVWSFKKQTVAFNLVSKLLISRILYERVPDYGVLGSWIKSSRIALSSRRPTVSASIPVCRKTSSFPIPDSRKVIACACVAISWRDIS